LNSSLVDEKIGFATRDSAQLISRGVTATRLSALAALNLNFKNLPNDSEMEGAVGEAVEIRKAAYLVLTDKIGNLRTMAENVFGIKSTTYQHFGFKGMISKDDKDLVFCAKQVKREAAARQAELEAEGLTTAFLNAFEDAIEDFDTKRDNIRLAKAARTEAALTCLQATPFIPSWKKSATRAKMFSG
jgi:hypothetical protein